MKGLYHPSVIAFLILLVVCAIGVYIIRSARFNKPIESFITTTEQYQQATQVEKLNLQEPNYNALVASALQTTPKTEQQCKTDYEFCITGGGQLKDCYSRYKSCLASVPQVVQPILQQPQPNANPMNIPTVTNMQMVQEGSTVPPTVPILSLEEIKAIYVPLAQKQKPHEEPQQKPTPLTATLDTDKGTMAEQIQRTSVIAPSMRDMIRREVSDVVRQELEGAQYDNPHAIQYK